MPGPHGGTLTTFGLCAYCEAPTYVTCRLCGRAMCMEHAVEGEPVCMDCGRGPMLDD